MNQEQFNERLLKLINRKAKVQFKERYDFEELEALKSIYDLTAFNGGYDENTIDEEEELPQINWLINRFDSILSKPLLLPVYVEDFINKALNRIINRQVELEYRGGAK